MSLGTRETCLIPHENYLRGFLEVTITNFREKQTLFCLGFRETEFYLKQRITSLKNHVSFLQRLTVLHFNFSSPIVCFLYYCVTECVALCHENNTLRTFEIIPSTPFYHGYIYRRLVRWDSKKLVWLSILLKSSQSDLFSRNLVLSRAVFDSFSFEYRCFLILLKEAWERNNEQMSRFHVQPRLEIPWDWRKGH